MCVLKRENVWKEERMNELFLNMLYEIKRKCIALTWQNMFFSCYFQIGLLVSFTLYVHIKAFSVCVCVCVCVCVLKRERMIARVEVEGEKRKIKSEESGKERKNWKIKSDERGKERNYFQCDRICSFLVLFKLGYWQQGSRTQDYNLSPYLHC